MTDERTFGLDPVAHRALPFALSPSDRTLFLIVLLAIASFAWACG
jgi:hypothetical protein